MSSRSRCRDHVGFSPRRWNGAMKTPKFSRSGPMSLPPGSVLPGGFTPSQSTRHDACALHRRSRLPAAGQPLYSARVEGSLRRRFERVVALGDELDLARAALVVASIDHEPVDELSAITELEVLAAGARVRLQTATDPHARVRALMDFLFRERGFRGNQDQYYDPHNSCLDHVLTRRLGIPITLSVVAIEVAARLDIRLDGIAFPGHFLIRAT